jgi:glutathione S-transferase
MNTPLLWHIPLSLYSEKVRWALDYKGIAHRRQVTVKRKPASKRKHTNAKAPAISPLVPLVS